MTRTAKQVIYGVGYISIFLLICFWVWSAYLKPSPTCFDGVLNQEETGIDCGGMNCVSCELKDLATPVLVGSPQFFELPSGGALLFFEFKNINSTYGAKPVLYTVKIIGKDGSFLQTISESEWLYPSEDRYAINMNVNASYQEIERAEISFEVSYTDWISAEQMTKPNVGFFGSPETIATGTQGIKVSGVVQNQSPFIARNVKIIALLYSKTGTLLKPSQTIFSEVGGFSQKGFTISFAKDDALMKAVDPTRTKVFIYSR